MPSIGSFTLVMPSLHADSDGDPEGGQISSSLTAVPSGKDQFFPPISSLPTGQGVNRRYHKMFLKNNSASDVLVAKLWIHSQERTPQIKIALERNSAMTVIALNYSTFVNTPQSLPPGLQLTDFTLAPSSGVGLLCQGTGALPANSQQGFWVMQQLSEGLIGDSSVPARFQWSISN